MLLNFRIQEKTKSIVFQAPDGTMYQWAIQAKPTEDDTATLLQEIGKAVLETLNDPDQPVATMQAGEHITEGQGNTPPPRQNAGASLGDMAEAMVEANPLLAGILGAMRGISSDDG